MTTLTGQRPTATIDAGERAELFRALGALAEPPGETQIRLADLLDLPKPSGVDWTEAFVVQLVPCAAIYVGAEGMLGGEAADRVAGFWRALRLPVPPEPDHLAALLGLYAHLIEAAQDEPAGPSRTLRAQARAAMLHEHLLSWLPSYAHAMADSGPPAYAEWACLLHEALLAEAATVGTPTALPAHLRGAAPLVSDEDRLDDLLAGLLTPVRSGVVLTRAHLALVARKGGLGLRQGSRRLILRAAIEQDPATAMAALTDLARAWHARHVADRPTIGPAAGFWADRAAATTDLLATAADQATRAGKTPRRKNKEEG